MASVNPFLQSPYQAIIDKQDDDEPKPLIGNQAVKDTPLPSIPSAKGEDDDEDTPAAAPAPAADPSSLLPPPSMRPLFETTAAHFKVPVNVLMALAQQESSYNPGAKNDSGATGMAQYLPATAKNLRIDPNDPNEAIPAMAMQLRERLDKGYSMADAVKEHFAGPDRKGWGDKTAAYGDSVLAKAGQIGQALYGDDTAAPDASTAQAPVPDTDTAQNNFAPTRMRRADYMAEFRKLNPRAPQAAVDAAMSQYDQQVAAAGTARSAAKTIGPKQIPSAEQFFNDRLNERLQGPANGIVPQLPGKMQPDQLQDVGTPDAQPSTSDTVAGNAIGGMLGTIVGAVAANAHLVGADDVAKDWSDGLAQIKDRQKQLGGDTFAGKTASLIGGIVPAMVAAPESKVVEFIQNSGMFGIPAFQETYKQKLAEGQSNKLALVHAFQAFGMNTLAPTIMQRGTGAIVGKLASEGAAGVKGAALGLGQAAGEGVGFSAANSVMDKGTDVLAGQQNNRPWLDPQDMAVQAAGFGAIRGAHIATHAVMPGAADPAALVTPDAASPSGPLSAALDDVVQKAAAMKAQGASVADQLRSIRPPEADPVAPPAGPLDAAMQDAAAQHAANPAPPVEQAPAAPQPPDLTQMSMGDLRAHMADTAQQASAAATPDQRKQLNDYRQTIEQEIGARGKQAVVDSKPAEVPLSTGPFDDIGAANKMMQRHATETGTPHEVVAQGDKFVVQPIGGGNGIDTAGNGHGTDGLGRSSGPAGGVGSDNSGGRTGTGDGTVEGQRTGIDQPAPQRADNAANHPASANGAGIHADAVANPYKNRQFPDQVRAENFLDKQGARDGYEAVQTGPVRWQVQPRGAQDAAAKPSRQPFTREITNARQEEEVRKAAENIARRKASKEVATVDHHAKLLDELDQTGSTRAQVLEFRRNDAQKRLSNLEQYPHINKHDQAEEVGKLKDEIAGLNAVEKRARDLDEKDARDYTTRFMLNGAKQEIDAAVRAGTMTEQQAHEATERARVTGNAADASKEIFDAVDKASPQPVAAEAPAPTKQQPTKPVQTGGHRLRESLKATNPFMAFLGQHGVHIEERSDTGGQPGRAGSVMIPGYGTLYRHKGARLDELAGLAHEAGFLTDHDMADPTDNGGTRKLADMIQRAAHNKEVITPAVDVEHSAPDADHKMLEEAHRLGIDVQGKSMGEVYDAVTDHHAGRFSNEEANAIVEMAQDSDIPFDLGDTRTENRELTDEELDDIFGPTSRHHGEDEGHSTNTTDASAQEIGSKSEGTASTAGSDHAKSGDGGTGQGSTDDPVLKSYSADEVRAKQDEQENRAKGEASAAAKAEQEAKAERDRKDVDARMGDSAEHFELGQDAHDSLAGQHSLLDIQDREEGDRRSSPRSADDRRTIEVDGVRRPIRDSQGRLLAGGDFMKQQAFWKDFNGETDEHGHPILGDDHPAVNDITPLMRDNRSLVQPPREASDGRGAEHVAAELRRARDAGEIDKATANFALWALDKSPSLARDLGINVRDPNEMGAAGSYHSAKQIINLFRGNENPGTAMHEILHHTERMMPAAIQKEILKAWQAAYDKAYEAGDAKTRAALEDMKKMATDRDAAGRVIAAFRDGSLKYGEHYQLSNPSEYWAVNATRIMGERFAADSWQAKAKQWLTELGQKVKGWLGLPSDAPILKGLDAVLNGTGERLSPKMLVEQMKDGESPALHDITTPREGDPSEPEVPENMRAQLGKLIARPMAQLHSAAHDVAMMVAPMTTGSSKGMAWAKEFANSNRRAAEQWKAMDTVLRNNFNEAQLRKMWEAADQENDLRREGQTADDKGLNALPQDQREVVELLHTYGEQLWQRAKNAGLVAPDAEGVAYWTPRMAANIYADGSVESLRPQSVEFSKDAKNLSTSANSAKHRKYETTAESDAALKAKMGEDASYVKNIRVMPLAMAQMEKAIAGRTLVNQIKAHGQVAGAELVNSEGGKDFRTFDHPALKNWRPRMKEEDGKFVPVTDSDGNVIMESAPLFVHRDFVGPLKSVLSSQLVNPSVESTYRGLMALKGASMSVIMASPATHNAVIWGKAMPSMISSMGWKHNLFNLGTAGGYTYVMGHKWRKDRALMNELVEGGLVPMSGRGMNPDIEAIGNGLKPGRSLVAKALGKVLDIASPKAGDAARKAVDAAGHFWHETLLWDRIGDMQTGMAVQIRDHLMDHGVDQYVATRIATHFANRYAGAIPQEAMSQGAHALLNVALFSKSFTGTNLGAMKDPIAGLPKDVQAQIREHFADLNRAMGMNDIEAYDAAGKKVKEAQSITRKKAGTILLADFGAMAVITSLTQAYFNGQNGQQFLDDLKKRAGKLGAKLDKDNPLSFLGDNMKFAQRAAGTLRHPFDSLQALSQTSDNPHGKQDRIRVGQDAHGNSYYLRLPFGKVAEEMKNYTNLSSATDLVDAKASPLVKGAIESWNNKDFYGRSVFDKNANPLWQAGQVVGHILKAQVPFDDLVALKNLTGGSADKGDTVHLMGADMNMDQTKLLGTATGMSVSKLAGGDAAAEMRYQAREQQQKVNDVMPDVKDAVMHGDHEKALKLLQDAGQTPQEMSHTMRYLMSPSVISNSRMRRFMQHTTPEEADRVSNMMQRQ